MQWLTKGMKAILAVLLSSSVVVAETFPDTRACVPSGNKKVLRQLDLMSWLLKGSGISIFARNPDQDGNELWTDKVSLVTSDRAGFQRYLADRRVRYPDANTRSADIRAQRIVRRRTTTFFREIGRPDNGRYRLVALPGAERVSFRKLANLFALSGSRARYFEIVCVAPKPRADKNQVGTRNSSGRDNDKNASKRRLTPLNVMTAAVSPIRLRGNIDELTIASSENNTAFKAASAATVSISENLVDERSEFSFEGAVGWSLAAFEDQLNEIRGKDKSPLFRIMSFSENAYFRDIIPFVHIHRRFTFGKKVDRTKHIDNFTFGALGEFIFDSAPLSFIANIKPQYTIDSKARTKIGAVTASLRPAFALFGNRLKIGGPPEDVSILLGGIDAARDIPLKYRFDIVGLLNYGYVIDAGGLSTIRPKHDFLRYGALISFTLFGTEGFLKPYKFSISYRVLDGVISRPEFSDYLEIALAHDLLSQGRAVIRFSYKAGTVDDTFQRVQLWELKFGLKF